MQGCVMSQNLAFISLVLISPEQQEGRRKVVNVE